MKMSCIIKSLYYFEKKIYMKNKGNENTYQIIICMIVMVKLVGQIGTIKLTI